VVGYCLGTPDSAAFFSRYAAEALPPLRAAHPLPTGPPDAWTPTQQIHAEYHGDERFPGPSPPGRGGYAPLAFSIVNRFFMALCVGAWGTGGALNSQNGGFRPGAVALGGTLAPPFVPAWVTECFPAHLHIDLLPHTHRHGLGSRLVAAQLQRLTELGASGVHLGMAPDNHRAYRFYKALGFVEIGRSAAGRGHLPALESSHS
jgi:GNAT superfamily N-acetyltransferase